MSLLLGAEAANTTVFLPLFRETLPEYKTKVLFSDRISDSISFPFTKILYGDEVLCSSILLALKTTSYTPFFGAYTLNSRFALFLDINLAHSPFLALLLLYALHSSTAKPSSVSPSMIISLPLIVKLTSECTILPEYTAVILRSCLPSPSPDMSTLTVISETSTFSPSNLTIMFCAPSANVIAEFSTVLYSAPSVTPSTVILFMPDSGSYTITAASEEDTPSPESKSNLI